MEANSGRTQKDERGLRQGRLSRAELFGLVIGEKVARQGEAFNDQMTRVGSIVKGLQYTIGQELLPVFKGVVDGMVSWYRANGTVIKSKLAEWVQGLIKFAQKLWPIFQRIGQTMIRAFNISPVHKSINVFKLLGDAVTIIIGLFEKLYSASVSIFEWFANTRIGKYLIDLLGGL